MRIESGSRPVRRRGVVLYLDCERRGDGAHRGPECGIHAARCGWRRGCGDPWRCNRRVRRLRLARLLAGLRCLLDRCLVVCGGLRGRGAAQLLGGDGLGSLSGRQITVRRGFQRRARAPSCARPRRATPERRVRRRADRPPDARRPTAVESCLDCAAVSGSGVSPGSREPPALVLPGTARAVSAAQDPLRAMRPRPRPPAA